MKMNMSKFKKIGGDKHHTIMEHEDGHVMTIAHAALSPKMREDMAKLPLHKGKEEKLADGGEVKQGAPDLNQDKVKQFQSNSIFNPSGKKQKMAEGGEAENPKLSESKKSPKEPLKIEKLEHAEPKEHVEYEAIEPKKVKDPVDYEPIKMADGGQVGDEIPYDKLLPQEAAQQAPYGTVGLLAPAVTPPPTPATVPIAAAPEPAAPMAQAPVLPSEPTGGPDTMSGYNKQVSGINKEAAANAAKGNEERDIFREQAKKLNNLAEDYQTHFNQLDQERKNFQDDVINHHIDPSRYLGSMDAGSRIATAIGLALGGLGSGIAGGPNLAMDFLNKQIDRDIEAQKAELGKKETLLSANMRQFGNLKDATDMTKIMQNDMIVAQLKQAEAKATSPIVRARAQQQIGQLEMQVAPMVQQLATRRMLAQGGEGSKTLQNVDPAKLIPAVVPEKEQGAAFKELQEAQTMSTAKKNILEAFNKLTQINTVGNRIASPIQTARQVASIKDPIVAGLSKATAGRFTEQDAGMLDSLFPKYGDSADTIAQKRKQVDKLVSEKMHFPVLSGYGLDPEKFASTSGSIESGLSPQQQSFAKWAKENPSDPRAALILKKLGLQ